MSELEQKFQQAAESTKNLKSRPTDEELLEIYALFKQATVGDNNQPKPGLLQLKEKAKHEFWMRKKGKFVHLIDHLKPRTTLMSCYHILIIKHTGMSQDDAKQAYIEKAESLVKAYGLK